MDFVPRGAALHAASTVYFGLNPMWVSTVILAVTYAIIMSEKVNRAIIALIGACVMVLVGVFSQEEAIKGIDWNTIGLLTGMMILVAISRRSGVFQFVAIWSAQRANALMLWIFVAVADAADCSLDSGTPVSYLTVSRGRFLARPNTRWPSLW